MQEQLSAADEELDQERQGHREDVEGLQQQLAQERSVGRPMRSTRSMVDGRCGRQHLRCSRHQAPMRQAVHIHVDGGIVWPGVIWYKIPPPLRTWLMKDTPTIKTCRYFYINNNPRGESSKRTNKIK